MERTSIANEHEKVAETPSVLRLPPRHPGAEAQKKIEVKRDSPKKKKAKVKVEVVVDDDDFLRVAKEEADDEGAVEGQFMVRMCGKNLEKC